MKQFLSSTKLRNYLILIASGIFLIVVTILAEFGDDTYEWTREKDGVPIEFKMNVESTEFHIREMIKGVKDPELDINIVDLGLLLDIKIENESVYVDMILTTPYCPYSSQIIDDIRKELFKYDSINNVVLTVKSEPAWSYDRLTEDGKKAVSEFFKGEEPNEYYN